MSRYYQQFCCLLLFVLINSFISNGQFPGYYVRHFNSENGMQNTVKGLLADKNGFAWIATESGLVRFDGSSFKLYNHAENNQPVNRLVLIGQTSQGMVYVKAANQTYYYISPENQLHSISASNLFKNDSLFHSSIPIASKLYDACKSKYIEKKAPSWVIPDLKKINRAYSTSIGCNNGNYYYLNANNELIVVDTIFNTFYKPELTGVPPPGHGVTATTLPTSIFQRGNNVYIRWGKQIYDMQLSPDKKTAVLTPVLYIGNISNIMDILQIPHSNSFIIGTLADGIYVFQKQLFSTLLQKAQEENIYYAQAPWGTDGVLTNKGIITPNNFIPSPGTFDNISIAKLHDGSYYMSRRDVEATGIARLDSQLRIIDVIPSNGDLIRCYKELPDKSVWICADSCFLGTIEKNSIRWVTRPANLPNTFDVSVFLEAGKNKFWVAGNKGMAKVDLSTGEVSIVHELVNVNVRSLYEDARGTIWICTYGNGFYALYKNKLTAFPVDKNGYLLYIHTMMPDKSGYMWMPTNHGIFQVKQADLYAYLDAGGQAPYYYYYDNTAGFLSNELNGGCYPAGIILGNGKYSFPSLKGLVQFFPDSLHPLLPEAAIFIDNVMADTVGVKEVDGVYNIPSNNNYLRVQVSSPYFGNSYNQLLEYSLDNGENSWHAITGNTIELNGLKKGNHSIFLRKQGGRENNYFITRQIRLFVVPSFYETALFKMLMGASLAVLVYLLLKIRTGMLVRQQKKLRQEVAEKTKEQKALIEELEKVVEELERSQTDLQKTAQFKQTLAIILAHDLQSPLRFLSDAMQRLHQTIPHQHEETAELSHELKNSSAKLHHFVDDFVTWIKKVNIDIAVEVGPVNIYALLMELHAFFAELTKARQNEIVIQASPSVNIYADYQLLKIMLRNIIDNANKHTFQGTIQIRLCTTNNLTSIEIVDSGNGIQPETLQKIMRRNSDSQTNSFIDNEGIGFGYRFIIDFCRLTGIALLIKSKPNNGTSVMLSNFRLVN